LKIVGEETLFDAGKKEEEAGSNKIRPRGGGATNKKRPESHGCLTKFQVEGDRAGEIAPGEKRDERESRNETMGSQTSDTEKLVQKPTATISGETHLSGEDA